VVRVVTKVTTCHDIEAHRLVNSVKLILNLDLSHCRMQ